MREQLVTCNNLIKIYQTGNLETVALQGLDLDIFKGEMSAIVGASGSGKSTLLNIMSGLDTPSAGRIVVAGHDLAHLNEDERARYRCQIVGYVWQHSGRNLFPAMTVEENLIVPQILNGTSAAQSKRRAHELLDLIGLPTYGKRRPIQLSGGQQQRVAIAVALCNQPFLLLADEPTGELDSTTTEEIIAFLRTLNKDLGITILIVTHDIAVAAQVDRTLAIRDGRTSTETIRRQASSAGTESAQRGSTVIGLSDQTHQEAIFIDHIGLLQLPSESLERVALRGRTEVRMRPDHIELWPEGTHDYLSHTDQGSSVIGLPAHSHRETILVDRVGRLQLPSQALEYLPFHGRAYLQVTSTHIQLWPLPQQASLPQM